MAKMPENMTINVNVIDPKEIDWDKIVKENIIPALDKFSREAEEAYDGFVD